MWVGGIDLCHANVSDLRSRIGVLCPDFASFMFSAGTMSASDGCSGRSLTRRSGAHCSGKDGQVHPSAFRRARCAALIDVHRQHQSVGGEWRRIALARLIYRDDTQPRKVVWSPMDTKPLVTIAAHTFDGSWMPVGVSRLRSSVRRK